MKTITGFLLGVTTTALGAMVLAVYGIKDELDHKDNGTYRFPGTNIVVMDREKRAIWLDEKNKENKDYLVGFRAP